MAFDFTNESDRKKAHELVKKIIEDHKNNLNLELTVNALKTIEELIETQERIIEDQEERIAIMTEGSWTDAQTNPPKEHGKYFAFTDNEEIIWVEFNPDYEDGEKWGWQDRQYDMNGCVVDSYWIPCTYKILYWMNIPEPPKEGEA